MFRVLKSVFPLLCLFAALPSSAGITLGEVLELAVRESPNYALIAQRASADRTGLEAQVGVVYPQVSFGTGAVYINKSLEALLTQFGDGFGSASGGASDASGGGGASLPRLKGMSYSWQLQVVQVANFNRLGLAVEVLRDQQQMIRFRRALEEKAFLAGIVNLYANAYHARSSLHLAQKRLEQLLLLLQTARRDSASGRISPLDFSRLKARTDLARSSQTMDSTLLYNHMRALQSKLGGGLDLELPDTSATAMLLPGASSQGRGNPEISLKKMETDFSDKQLRYQRSLFYPELAVVGGLSDAFFATEENAFSDLGRLRDPDFVDYNVGVQLSWNLYSGGQTSESLAEAKIRKRVAKTELEQLQASLLLDLSSAKSLTESQKNLLGTAVEMKRVESLEYQRILKDYESGAATLTELMDAEANWLQAGVNLSSARVNHTLARVNLKILDGSPLVEVR